MSIHITLSQPLVYCVQTLRPQKATEVVAVARVALPLAKVWRNLMWRAQVPKALAWRLVSYSDPDADISLAASQGGSAPPVSLQLLQALLTPLCCSHLHPSLAHTPS